VAGTGRLLGSETQADAGIHLGESASAPSVTSPEGAVKLICGKCRRVMDVRKKDIGQVGVCIEGCRPFRYPRDHWGAQHLVCPFCKVEGNGEYWLERMKKAGRAENQGEAA
jgi:hypothetical protein